MDAIPHSKRAHSPVGASSMYRWEACPGSVALCETVPNTTTPYAEEGTLAHEIAEECLRGQEVMWELLPSDMKPAVMTYVEYIESLIQDPDWQVVIERRFDLSQYIPECYGTADAVAYNEKQKLLRVIDYKHGKGVFVSVDDNSQCLYYALGVLLTMPKWRPEQVETVIVQPRFDSKHGKIRSATYPALYILFDFFERVKKAVEATRAADAPLYAGKHCKFCQAKSVCSEVGNARIRQAQQEFSFIE